MSAETNGGELPIAYSLLGGFSYDGQQMPLIGQKGIWKPRVLDLPISIITAAPNIGVEPPYPDEMTPDGRLLYRYEGTDPNLWTNVSGAVGHTCRKNRRCALVVFRPRSCGARMDGYGRSQPS